MSEIIKNAESANELHLKLIDGNTFDLPKIDFNKPPFNWIPGEDSPINKEVDPITVEKLTERRFKGDGVFDALMESCSNHIKEELKAGRITKNDYAQAWVTLTEACMANSVEFLIQKDSAYWGAIATQMQAKTSLIGLEAAKVAVAGQFFDSKTSEANFANTKMNTLNAESGYSTSEWNLKEMLPIQKELVEANVGNVSAETGLTKYRITDQLPAEVDLVKKNTDAVVIKSEIDEYTLTSMLPSQKELVDSQTANQKMELTTNTWLLKERMPIDKELVQKQIKNQEVAFDTATYTLDNILPAQLTLTIEQSESQRAQTLDSRSDGQTVKGSIGKQKDLYSQQIDSYKRDAEYKVGKFYVDAFITMKTIDEGLLAPNNFTNTNIDKVLNSLKGNVNI